jgi:3-isopropylmalate/(R)-2-methylmalate dehydratase large subunit
MWAGQARPYKTMGLTFAEKVLSAKARREVRAGEIVTVEPDCVLSHDNSAAIARHFKEIGVARVRHPERLVIVLDHCVPAADFKHATNHREIREFVREQGITGFYDIHHGVCHQVLLERGYARPGRLLVGSDSHTTSYGAVGAFSAGIGRTEAACTWATGELWLRVPETLRIVVTGEWPRRVGAKDLMLHVAGLLGADGADYMSVEWTGAAIAALSVDARIVLCNMSAELGAKNGYVPADAKVAEWLDTDYLQPRYAQDADKNYSGAAVPGRHNEPRAGTPAPLNLHDYAKWHTDPDARIARTVEVDITDLPPQIARPHRVDNVVPVDEVKGKRVHQCLLGTCTNGRIEDIAAAWDVLDGKGVHPGVRLLVFPASQTVNYRALISGYVEKFITAGAVWMNPGCGPCLGAHEGALAPGEVCISTSNRNFRGRMGTPESEIYLASPQSVAAAAVTGEITDPREL